MWEGRLAEASAIAVLQRSRPLGERSLSLYRLKRNSIMSTILSYAALTNGQPGRSSLEVLSRARELAVASGWSVEAITTSGSDEVVGGLSNHGAARIHVTDDEVFSQHVNAPLVDLLATTIASVSPKLVVFPSTEGVKDILGALSARLGAPVLADVASFEIVGDAVEARRPVMAAKFISRVRASFGSAAVLVSVRSGSYQASESPVEASVSQIEFVSSELKQNLRDVAEAVSGMVSLEEARVVVAAGRGIRDDSGKKLIEELAAVTGAAIGASRAVVESGFFPATAQIGQTGKVVSPELYFAVGLSGAIQHTAGMSNSRVIVAINKDPDAPIFKLATYGLVGDLHTILPQLIEEIRKARG